MNHLLFDFKDLSVDSTTGKFSGYANVTGNVDRANEIVQSGAYSNLSEFAKSGWVALAHDWNDLPIATISTAREDANGLYLEGEFHSHEKAQATRGFVAERIARGKTVSMSIGYRVLADEMNKEGVRVLKSIELFEASFVNVPANPQATVTGVKGLADGSFSEMLEGVADALETLVRRTSERADMRAKAGRVLSRTNREMLSATRDRCKEACDSLTDLIDATDPGEGEKADSDNSASDTDIAALQMEAFALGLPL